jgi:predicted transcriptional regulator
MKTTSNNSMHQSEGENISKKKIQEKPSFQDFILTLKSALYDSKGKDSVVSVYRHIKKGFKEAITPDHINEICQNIFPWEHFSRLTLKIVLEFNLGHPSGLIRRLIPPFRQEAAKRTSFPLNELPLTTTVSDPQRWHNLRNWIKTNSHGGTIDSVWVRNALICITSEKPSYDEFSLVQLLLEESDIIRKKIKAFSDKHERYMKQIGGFFISKKFTPSKLSFGLDISEIFRDRLEKMEVKMSNLEEKFLAQEDRLSELQEKLIASEESLEETLRETKKLNEEIKTKEQAFLEEKARYNSLDEHWKRKLDRELRGQVYQFKKYFEHEIREATLALNRENPNIEMALSRIKNMEEYLNKTGETE